VRVPASYCGLWGIRPTHGRISLAGAAPLAPSFDTVGWFAPSAPLLRAAGAALLAPDAAASAPLPPGRVRWLVGRDAFTLATPEAGAAVYGALSGPAFEGVTAALGQPQEIEIGSVPGAPELDGLKAWMGVFRVTQVRRRVCGWEWGVGEMDGGPGASGNAEHGPAACAAAGSAKGRRRHCCVNAASPPPPYSHAPGQGGVGVPRRVAAAPQPRAGPRHQGALRVGVDDHARAVRGRRRAAHKVGAAGRPGRTGERVVRWWSACSQPPLS
jgi:hypothetical protein